MLAASIKVVIHLQNDQFYQFQLWILLWYHHGPIASPPIPTCCEFYLVTTLTGTQFFLVPPRNHPTVEEFPNEISTNG